MLKKDRDYYRTVETTTLKEEVHYGIDVDWQELAIAMAERLDDIRRETLDETEQGSGYDGEWNYCPECGYELR